MKLTSANFNGIIQQRAFTLVELMVAMSIGLVLAGTVVLLLVQGSLEQRRGYADTTVEESSYTLQAHISGVLRSMSASQGFSDFAANATYNTNGVLMGYQTIYVWQANPDGSYTGEKISYDPVAETVTYTPNTATPASQTVWTTSGPNVALHNLYFSGSLNPDSSPNNSLVNVNFLMDDNGYSQQGPTNNPASIYRSFSVQMRVD
jgi:prepilin-type N-terminal cleavage/methylation domain-containing protein